MTNIRPLSELSAIPKKAYFPIDQIGEVAERFVIFVNFAQLSFYA